MLESNDLEMNRVDFLNNTSGLYGGSVYLGESHASVLLSGVTVKGSAAGSGGGLYFSRFSTDVRIVSCYIMQNRADIGGGLVSFANSLTIGASSIEDNVAMTSCGGLLVEDAVDELVLEESSVRKNVAGSSGGICISKSGNITVRSCVFEENQAVVGSAGALSFLESQVILVRNTTFLKNSAMVAGGAAAVDTFSSHITLLDTIWQENRAGGDAGAFFVADTSPVEVNDSKFIGNVAQTGSGSAIYVRASNISLSSNIFSGNEALGGGTVFWEHGSGMEEPTGLLANGNEFDDSNAAGYGPYWATEAYSMRLVDDKEVYSIVNYEAFAPLVGVTLQDAYQQTVTTDSTALASVDIPPSQDASCDNAPGFVSGSTTVTFLNGTATFSALEPLCAPNHSLILSASASLATVADNTNFEFDFRACLRGEYYEERICNPCEEGTYSFTDPIGLGLSEITKTLVCEQCPVEASSCYKDTIVLKSGYWRHDNDSTNILECPWDAESCLGGQSSGDASCGSGYHGPLCAICEDDYHYVPSSRTCEPCDDTASFFDPFTITLIILIFLCLLIAVFVMKKVARNEAVSSVDNLIAICLVRLHIYDEDAYSEDKDRMFHKTHMRRKRAFKSCVVYFTFYQIVSTLPFILEDVDFPDVYDRLISAVSVVNLAINQEAIVGCSSSAQYDYVTKLVVSTTYPMVIVVLLWLCYRIHLWFKFSSRGSHSSDNCNRSNSNQQMIDKRNISLGYKNAVLVLSFLILPSGE